MGRGELDGGGRRKTLSLAICGKCENLKKTFYALGK